MFFAVNGEVTELHVLCSLQRVAQTPGEGFRGHWIWREKEAALLSKLEAAYRNYLGSLKMQPPEALSDLVLHQNLQGRDTGICLFNNFLWGF